MNEYQHLETCKKGDSVQCDNKLYRVQEDKGWLFILVPDRGKRVKVGVDRLLFSYGSFQDWVFNEWWRQYPEYEEFRVYAEAEKLHLPYRPQQVISLAADHGVG